MLRQLGDAIPVGVTITVRGKGNRCYITASHRVPEPYVVGPDDPAYAKLHGRRRRKAPRDDGNEGVLVVPMGSLSGEFSPAGYGAWIPFLPRRLANKLAMIDILESIQGTISGGSTGPWPGEGFTVKADEDGDQIRLWFESPSGTKSHHITMPADFGRI